MDKREKFYFRKQYGSSTSKNFYRIYDLLVKNPLLTVSEVQAHFHGTSIARNFHYEMNTLYKKILRVLNIYRMNSDTPVMKILNQLQYIEILIEKKQLVAVQKLLKKTRKLAYDNEEFSILIKIIGIEEYLFFSFIDSNLVQKISLLETERNSCVAKIQEYNEQKLLKNQLIDFQFSTGLYTDEPEKYPHLFKNPLLEKREKIQSRKAEDLWMFNVGMVHTLTGNHIEGEKYYRERISHIQQHFELFSSQEYLGAINNYLFLMGLCQDLESFVEIHDELNGLYDAAKIPASTINFVSYYTQLSFYTIRRDFKVLSNLVVQASNFLFTEKLTLNETQIDELFFYLTNALVAMRKHDQALSILTKWNQYPTLNHGFARKKILWYVTHLSLDNYKLLSNELASFNMGQKKKTYFTISLKLFAKYLRKITKNPQNKTKQLTLLIKELESLKKKHAIQLPIVAEFDLLKWCTLTLDPLRDPKVIHLK